MSLGRVESGEASRSTVTRSENEAQSLRALLSAIRWAMRSSHSKRRLVSKWVHWRQARMAAWQLGHCSSVEFAIGSTAPQAAHRDTVCCASIPPLRGASLGGGSRRRSPGSGGRYPCWRYLRSRSGMCFPGLTLADGSIACIYTYIYRVAVTIPFVSVLVLGLGLLVSAGHAGASNTLDYVTF